MKAQRQWLKAVKAAVAAAVEQRAVFNKEVRAGLQIGVTSVFCAWMVSAVSEPPRQSL